MNTYSLKSVVRRGGLLSAAFALVLATVVPFASTYADALNPLTERSLTLSSGSPGWNFKDASGNSTYAPPNSGANGQKTGNTFSFRVSSTEAIKSFNFQYCTTPAGNCMGPGNNALTGGVRASNAASVAAQKSDLEVVVDEDTNGEIAPATFTAKFDAGLGQPKSVNPTTYDPDTIHPNMPALDGSEGNFIVLTKRAVGDNWAPVSGWTMEASVKQTTGGSAGVVADGTSTGKNNFIKISNANGAANLQAGDYVKVIFFATDTTYITNPGAKEFFVKINSYNDATVEDEDTLVDGGVTVANVMNRSIEIQTKVLETMDFSVGTVDPNTLDSTDGDDSQLFKALGRSTRTACDPIVQGMDSSDTAPKNILQMGNPDGEFSLKTDTTYSTHSYWRLSSNSSAGATVYYSGVTLSNTVGDQIKAIGTTSKEPTLGGEQFGLALDNDTTGQRLVSYAKERTAGSIFQNGADNDVAGVHATVEDDLGNNLSYHAPRLAPLAPKAAYAEGKGNVNGSYGAVNTKFAFDPESSVIPAPLAEGNEVLDCVTGKMRYIANIAATTPAGIYTTKINYIAAPKY